MYSREDGRNGHSIAIWHYMCVNNVWMMIIKRKEVRNLTKYTYKLQSKIMSYSLFYTYNIDITPIYTFP